MAAMLVFGKGFKMEETHTPSGQPCKSVVGIDGDLASITWSSVREMQALAEKHGVRKEAWPVYPDCDVESEVPMEDAVQRSAELRMALEKVDPRVIEGDYWLAFVWKLLRDGNVFFVMI